MAVGPGSRVSGVPPPGATGRAASCMLNDPAPPQARGTANCHPGSHAAGRRTAIRPGTRPEAHPRPFQHTRVAMPSIECVPVLSASRAPGSPGRRGQRDMGRGRGDDDPLHGPIRRSRRGLSCWADRLGRPGPLRYGSAGVVRGPCTRGAPASSLTGLSCAVSRRPGRGRGARASRRPSDCQRDQAGGHRRLFGRVGRPTPRGDVHAPRPAAPRARPGGRAGPIDGRRRRPTEDRDPRSLTRPPPGRTRPDTAESTLPA